VRGQDHKPYLWLYPQSPFHPKEPRRPIPPDGPPSVSSSCAYVEAHGWLLDVMIFALLRAEYDPYTERAYVDFRASDADGAEAKPPFLLL